MRETPGGRRAARAFWLIVIGEIEVGAVAITAHPSAARVSMHSSSSRIVAAPMPENGCITSPFLSFHVLIWRFVRKGSFTESVVTFIGREKDRSESACF